MNKFLFFPLIWLTFAFAQPSISINSSIGYSSIVIDYFEVVVGNTRYWYKDYPIEAISFDIGASCLIPIKDIAKFDAEASIGYLSGTIPSDEEFDLTLSESKITLNLYPGIRFEREEKIYARVGFVVSIPLLHEQTIKVSRYTYTYDIDPLTLFGATLFGRYKHFGVGLGKVLNGGDNATHIDAKGFITISEKFEIVPSIGYAVGNTAKQYSISAGVDYSF